MGQVIGPKDEKAQSTTYRTTGRQDTKEKRVCRRQTEERGKMASTLSFSLRTFIKQFSPLSKRTRFNFPIRTSFKRLNVTCNSSRFLHFETLTSRQKDQVHLFVDALLQWNQVLGFSFTLVSFPEIALVFLVVSFSLMDVWLNYGRK